MWRPLGARPEGTESVPEGGHTGAAASAVAPAGTAETLTLPRERVSLPGLRMADGHDTFRAGDLFWLIYYGVARVKKFE